MTLLLLRMCLELCFPLWKLAVVTHRLRFKTALIPRFQYLCAMQEYLTMLSACGNQIRWKKNTSTFKETSNLLFFDKLFACRLLNRFSYHLCLSQENSAQPTRMNQMEPAQMDSFYLRTYLINHQFFYYVHFHTNNFGKGMNSLIPHSFGLNSTPTVLQQ